MVWIVLLVAGLLVIIQISSVIAIEHYQFKQNEKLKSTLNPGTENSANLVVYFSRSGNTELMACKIAQMKQARLVNLIASQYRIGLEGWVNAMLDARKTNAVISPRAIDLSRYDTIYIGAPIWLYSPAPPVFEFVRQNNFTGKKVVLFNSLNSKFEQKYIDEFSRLVAQSGGTLIKHIAIVRGRMTRQMRIEDFLEAVERELLK